jgi:hypothetical protein
MPKKKRPQAQDKLSEPIDEVTASGILGAGRMQRIGFLAGQIKVPDDFDRMGEAEIAALFLSLPKTDK